jgi:hypothetical protein
MPCHSSRRTVRARRPRPSERTTLRIIPGFSPQGHPSWDGPPRGGAGSARPEGRHHADPNIAPSWPPASRKGTGGNAMPCHSSRRTVRARRPRPSERTTLRIIPGFSPQGHPSWDGPPRGGAGSARPEGRHHADPNIAPSWPPASRKGTGGNAMPCHSSRRTVRARRPRPSERTTLHIIPGFSPKGLSPRLAPRGGAGSARPQTYSAWPLPSNHRSPYPRC